MANSSLQNVEKVDFSVVTISKNDFKGLRDTVNSLLIQDSSSWELIIVLNDSNDGSLEYCKSILLNESRINLVVQQGSGIYDAMNQGISSVRGKYLWFMNSGDTFYDRDTLREVSGMMGDMNFDILIGGYQIRNQDHDLFTFRESVISPRRFSLNIRSGCHQATVFRVHGIEKSPVFRTDLTIASDFDWILRQLKDKSCYRIKRTLATIEPGGISDKGIRQVISEKQIIREDVFGRYSIDAFLGHLWSIGVLTKIYSRRFLVYLRTISR